jgi:hypothetical protein
VASPIPRRNIIKNPRLLLTTPDACFHSHSLCHRDRAWEIARPRFHATRHYHISRPAVVSTPCDISIWDCKIKLDFRVPKSWIVVGYWSLKLGHIIIKDGCIIDVCNRDCNRARHGYRISFVHQRARQCSDDVHVLPKGLRNIVHCHAPTDSPNITSDADAARSGSTLSPTATVSYNEPSKRGLAGDWAYFWVSGAA